jgi:TolA-binding protein
MGQTGARPGRRPGTARPGRGHGPWGRAVLGLVVLWLGLGLGLGLAQESAESRLFEAAVRGFQTGAYSWAEAEFGRFVEQYPASPLLAEALLYQARAALEQQKSQVAIQLLSTNLARAGALADAYRYWLGKAYLDSANYPAAAAAFNQLIREQPQSPRLLEASYGEAVARFKLRDWPQVIALLQPPDSVFQTAARARPNDEVVVRGQLLLAEALLEAQQFDAANQALQPLANRDLLPEYKWRLAYLQCRLRAAADRPEAALQLTSNLVALAAATGQPSFLAESYALQGDIQHRLGLLEAARASYTNNLAPSIPAERRREALLKIIGLALAQDKLTEAVQGLATFLAQFPQDAGSDLALLTLGEVHLKYYLSQMQPGAPAAPTNELLATTNALETALGHFDKLLATFTNSPLQGKAHLNRGWCLWLQGRIADSAAAFQAAAQTLPLSEDQAVARFKLADAQTLQKDYTNALANYRKLISEHGALPRVRSELVELALYQTLRVSLELGDLKAATEALEQLLRDYPAGPLTDRGVLWVSQRRTQAGQAAEARALLNRFLQLAPQSPLRAEVELALARTHAAERDWAGAIASYQQWLGRHTTNAHRPEVLFSLAWAHYQAGQTSNAFNLFTNFLAQFPTHRLAPQAQYWLGDFYYGQKDFVNAQKNYQRVFENTNWVPGALAYQARLMAGRAAFARQVWKDAGDHFWAIVSANDTNCPPDLVAEAYFALGDTRLQEDPNPAQPVNRFEQARLAFERIPQLFPTSRLVPLAWGRIGDCYLQQAAAQDTKYYDNALDAYRKVLQPELKADLSTRCQAEMGLGLVLERQAALKKPPERLTLLRTALDHYLNIVFGRNLAPGEQLDPVWFKEASLAAARLAEELQQWDLAAKLYDNLAAALPALRRSLDKKIEQVRQRRAASAN